MFVIIPGTHSLPIFFKDEKVPADYIQNLPKVLSLKCVGILESSEINVQSINEQFVGCYQ